MSSPADPHHALVFLRAGGAKGLGHVGWAFTVSATEFCGGAIENEDGWPIAMPGKTGAVTWYGDDPVAMFKNAPLPYECYKVVPLGAAGGQPQRAEAEVEAVCADPYLLFSKNCLDATFRVLSAYGVPALPGRSQFLVSPTIWFAHLPGTIYGIDVPFYWSGHPEVRYWLGRVQAFEVEGKRALAGLAGNRAFAGRLKLLLGICGSIHQAAAAEDWPRVVAEARLLFRTVAET